MTVVRIGPLEVNPGTRTDGYLSCGIPDRTTDQLMRVPVSITAGARPGPTLAVTAGTHGGEYPGIEACLRLIDLLDPDTLQGTVVAIPRLNGAAFFSRSIYVSPIDGLNLNRVFPGRPDGSPTERLAHLLTDQVIAAADYYVDLHSGDINEDLQPFSFCCVSGDQARDAMSRRLASQFPGGFILASRTDGATLTSARLLGIPGVLSEAGGRGRVDDSAIDFHLSGLRNILTTLDMFPGGTTLPEREPAVACWVSAGHTGYLRMPITLGQRVEQGEPIGDVRDDFGRPIESVLAPGGGIVFFKVDSLAVTAGELLAGVLQDT